MPANGEFSVGWDHWSDLGGDLEKATRCPRNKPTWNSTWLWYEPHLEMTFQLNIDVFHSGIHDLNGVQLGDEKLCSSARLLGFNPYISFGTRTRPESILAGIWPVGMGLAMGCLQHLGKVIIATTKKIENWNLTTLNYGRKMVTT